MTIIMTTYNTLIILRKSNTELSAHCISGKPSAAILGKPSVENLAEPMKMAVSGSVMTSY